MHFAVLAASKSHIALIGLHWKMANQMRGSVKQAVKTMKMYMARFNQTFGKIRRYMHNMLYFRMSKEKPQKTVAM